MDKELALSVYETMQKIRLFELKALQLFEENKLRGSVHLYVGEEAIAASVCAHLRDDDYITSTHRGHGHCIAKGASLDTTMAELMGKVTGCCKGRSGSMHIADFEKGNLGANAIVGAGLPIAVGAALSIKLRKTDQVAVAFFGEGASNEGVFHEALNMAGLWKLPVIFVCENNGYGISVPQWQSTAVQDISVRAAGYDMPGVTVDGNDVLTVGGAFSEAVKRARSGEGPTLIECKTYRWFGHWTGDPCVYRTRAEVDEWKKKDPITSFRRVLTENYRVSLEHLDDIDAKVWELVEAAVTFGLESPEPDPARLLDDVFYIPEEQAV